MLAKRLLVWIGRRVTGQDRKEAERCEAERARYRSPRWDFYEIRLGRAAPTPLRKLYADPELATHPVARIDDQVLLLHPIDESSMIRVPGVPVEVLRIADTEAGEPVYLKPQGEPRQSAVFYFRDLDEEAVLFDDVESFVRAVENGQRWRPSNADGR